MTLTRSTRCRRMTAEPDDEPVTIKGLTAVTGVFTAQRLFLRILTACYSCKSCVEF